MWTGHQPVFYSNSWTEQWGKKLVASYITSVVIWAILKVAVASTFFPTALMKSGYRKAKKCIPKVIIIIIFVTVAKDCYFCAVLQFILIPCHINNVHWILLVIATSHD